MMRLHNFEKNLTFGSLLTRISQPVEGIVESRRMFWQGPRLERSKAFHLYLPRQLRGRRAPRLGWKHTI